MQYAITVTINAGSPENVNAKEFVREWVTQNHLEIQTILASGFEITHVMLHNSMVHNRLSASIVLQSSKIVR